MMSTAEKYRDKYISILGDSISTLEGYNKSPFAEFYNGGHKLLYNVHGISDTWWGMLIEHLGGKLLSNDSYLGTMVSDDPRGKIYGPPASDDSRIGNLAKGGIEPELIIVFIGFNDWENAIPNFYAAYHEMLKKIKGRYSSADIWVMSLPRGYIQGDSDMNIPPQFDCMEITPYNEAIEFAAVQENCTFINLNDLSYETLDGSHPTGKGMREIFLEIKAQI